MSEIHSIGPFVLGKSLGSGATGKVKLGFHKDTGFKVAIKIMNKEVLSSRPSMRKKVEREIVVMKLIDHPNVLKLHDVYETSKFLFLVTEYVEGGELFDYLINKGSLDPTEALRLFRQLIGGLDHCHNQRICHRDLKPENLLLDADKNLKIGDFGMAALMRRGASLSTSCGSPHYASPEVVSGKHYSGMTADIWSCGVILYALLTGKLPFDDDDIRKLLTKVKNGVFSMPAFLPSPAQDLITRMLTVDPTKRITMTQIKEHKWFTTGRSPDTVVVQPFSVEDMPAEPLADAAQIDDEILRSLRVLGLGSDMDIEHSLTSKIPNLTLSFYRLLQERKEKQSNNTYQARSNRNRNMNDIRERSISEHTQRNFDNKTRSNSFSQQQQDRPHAASLHARQRRQSPFVDVKRGGSSPGIFAHGASSAPTSPATATFSVSDDTATVLSLSSSSVEPSPISPRTSPRTSPPGLNQNRISPPLQKDSKKSPVIGSAPSSSPILISNKSRVMKLASEGNTSPNLSSSPIIGSNPKRSWFSNFFTGSPHTAFLDEEDAGPNLTINDQQANSPAPTQQPNQPPTQHAVYHHPNHASHHPPRSPRHHNNQNNHNHHNQNNHNHHNNHHNQNNHHNHNHNHNHARTQNPAQVTTGFNVTKSSSLEESPPTSPEINNNESKPTTQPTTTDTNTNAPKTPTLGARDPRNLARASIEMQTVKSGIELGAEIQRTLCALKTDWRLHTNELYTASAEGSTCHFSVQLVDNKTNPFNLISVCHLGGTSTFFDTLCSRFQAEVKL